MALILGLSFIFQTVLSQFMGDQGETAPEKQANKKFTYEEAVEQQKREGGARRYYGDDELDIESAQVADADGNPIGLAAASS